MNGTKDKIQRLSGNRMLVYDYELRRAKICDGGMVNVFGEGIYVRYIPHHKKTCVVESEKTGKVNIGIISDGRIVFDEWFDSLVPEFDMVSHAMPTCSLNGGMFGFTPVVSYGGNRNGKTYQVYENGEIYDMGEWLV